MTDVSIHDVPLPVLVAVAVAPILLVVLAGWLTRQLGMDGRSQVRAQCRDGHVFTTTLLPVFMLPVPRVGLVQFRYCPVGQHWTFVWPIGGQDRSP